jgi:drug/metabolite transporter (DMT)-like permease
MQHGTGTSLALGLLAQACFAVGFSFVAAFIAKERVHLHEELTRTVLVLCFGTVLAFVVAFSVWATGAVGFGMFKLDSWAWLAAGAIVAILVGEVFYLAGISARNLTTVSYTSLAFPVFAFAIDWWRGKAEISVKDFIAFALMCAGFILLAYSPGKEGGVQ